MAKFLPLSLPPSIFMVTFAHLISLSPTGSIIFTIIRREFACSESEETAKRPGTGT